jgi:hypothetical protein
MDSIMRIGNRGWTLSGWPQALDSPCVDERRPRMPKQLTSLHLSVRASPDVYMVVK